MAFSSTITAKTVMGRLRCHYGTYTGTAVTTGDIDTGLRIVTAMSLTAGGAAIVADAPTINETLPIAGSAVTIIFTSGSTGYWIAWGYQ